MPIDHTQGEVIEGLGHGFVVLTQQHKCQIRGSDFFEIAASHAAEVFFNAGALLPITFDDEEVVIQHYPCDNKLAFFVHEIHPRRRALLPVHLHAVARYHRLDGQCRTHRETHGALNARRPHEILRRQQEAQACRQTSPQAQAPER